VIIISQGKGKGEANSMWYSTGRERGEVSEI
jgi:hypothetical protein